MEINPGKQEIVLEPKKSKENQVFWEFFNVNDPNDFFLADRPLIKFIHMLEGLFHQHAKNGLKIPVNLSELEWKVLKLYASEGKVFDDPMAISILNFLGVESENPEALQDFHRIRLQEWYTRNFMDRSIDICKHDLLENVVLSFSPFPPTHGRDDVAVFPSPKRIWNFDGSNAFLDNLASVRELKKTGDEEQILFKLAGILDLTLFHGKLVLAGGSLVSLILGQKVSDYDLFLVNVTTDELNDILEQLHLLFTNLSGKIQLQKIFFNANTWTWTLTDSQLVNAKERMESAVTFQLVFRNYKSVEEIMLGFDLDPCCIVYNGKDFLISDRAQWAFKNHALVVDHTRISLSHGYRTWKYWKRGFDVIIPGLDFAQMKLPKNMELLKKYWWCFKCFNNVDDGTTEIGWKATKWSRRRRRRVSNDKPTQEIEQILSKLLSSVHISEPTLTYYSESKIEQFNLANILPGRTGRQRPLPPNIPQIQFTADEQQIITSWLQTVRAEFSQSNLSVITPPSTTRVSLGSAKGLDLLIFFIVGLGEANIKSQIADYGQGNRSSSFAFPVVTGKGLVIKYGQFLKSFKRSSNWFWINFEGLMNVVHASNISPQLNVSSPMAQHTSSFQAQSYVSMQSWLKGNVYARKKESVLKRKVIAFDL